MLRTPSGGAGTAPPPRQPADEHRRRCSTLLRDEFPDVTISKIRFLEAEGLVEPRAHSVRLPQVQPRRRRAAAATSCAMQRDHYLPLKVIREQLDALERGEQVQLPARPRRASGTGRRRRGEPIAERPTAARVGRAELLAARRGRRGASCASGSRTGWSRPAADGGYDAEAVTVAPAGRRARPVRARAAAPAGDESRRRPRGRAGRAGGRAAAAAPQSADQGPCGGHARGARRALVRLHAALVQTALGVRGR